MPVEPSEMSEQQHTDVTTALFAYWTSRDEARLAQQAKGAVDVGERAGVTSGAHLDHIARLFAQVCIDSGAPPSQVYYKAPRDDPNKRANVARGFTLPGWFRPTKQWDVVVHHGYEGARQPIVVIELKSQNGPSYGNNANNRAEEAIGNAYDLRRASEEALFQGTPWTGYVFVVEDDIRSAGTVESRDKEPGFFTTSSVFNQWTYLTRVQQLCERLVAEEMYDSAWAVATARPTCPATPKEPDRCPQIARSVTPHAHAFNWRELDPEISGYAQFVDALQKKIRNFYPNGPTLEDRRRSAAPIRPSRSRRPAPPNQGGLGF